MDDPTIHSVTSFHDLVATPFQGNTNVIGWTRRLKGDFTEIVNRIQHQGNITVVDKNQLLELHLSTQGQIARKIILDDWQLLEAHGAAPVLNLIEYYERDDSFFSTDVYSFHVDRSPIPTDTFLCTYYGETSEVLPNAHAIAKALVPEIRDELQMLYRNDSEKGDFESFLTENFFDLHYQALADARPIRLELGHLYRLAIDYPESPVLPCIHRAPDEKMAYRLLMIC